MMRFLFLLIIRQRLGKRQSQRKISDPEFLLLGKRWFIAFHARGRMPHHIQRP
jgi:hypothetical protein